MFEKLMQVFWIGTSIILGIMLIATVCFGVYMYDKMANEQK